MSLYTASPCELHLFFFALCYYIKPLWKTLYNNFPTHCKPVQLFRSLPYIAVVLLPQLKNAVVHTFYFLKSQTLYFLCLHKTDTHSLCSQSTHLGGSYLINALPKIDAGDELHLFDFVMHIVYSMTCMVKGQCSDQVFVFRCEAKTWNTTAGNERRSGLPFVFFRCFI
jgi:hypothetical protein